MWIVTLLGGWRGTALAALFVLAGIFAGVQTVRLTTAKADLVEANAKITVYKSNEANLEASNASKDAAVKDLQSRLDAMVGLKQEIEKARDAAVTAQATAAKARDKALADLKSARRQIYERDALARLWAVTPVPPSLTRQLRDQWSAASGGDQGQGSGSGSTPIRGDSGAAAGAGNAGSTAATGVHDSDCRDGCYSDDQLFGATTVALDALQRCNGQLNSIAVLSRTAVATNSTGAPQ